jgi:N-acetylglucosamine malate deacetylase 1
MSVPRAQAAGDRRVPGERLLTLYEAEDQYMGRLFGVTYAETFRSYSPLLIDDLVAFKPVLHG